VVFPVTYELLLPVGYGNQAFVDGIQRDVTRALGQASAVAQSSQDAPMVAFDVAVKAKWIDGAIRCGDRLTLRRCRQRPATPAEIERKRLSRAS
jgi:hypothetical protein